MRYIAHALNSDGPNSVREALPNHAAIHADIFELRMEIDRYRGTERRGDLCAALFDSFEDRMAAEFELGDDVFRAAQNSYFRDLRKIAGVKTGDFAGAAEGVQDHRKMFEAGEEAFASAPGLSKLDALLHYISRRTGRQLIFFVDNVDRHSQELQVKRAEHLASLSTTMKGRGSRRRFSSRFFKSA